MARFVSLFATFVLAATLLTPASAQETSANTDLPLTVVAVVDSGFSPYNYNVAGHQHPWNRDADPTNDIDFAADPSTYIEGHPGGTAIEVTVPTTPFEFVRDYRSGQDATAWEAFERSTGEDVKLHWFPGTKIVGAVSFEDDPERETFYGTNDAHGTRSATSAGGNLLGTCPTCLFVLVKSSAPEALAWAASQSWIDVVTNSYGHSTVGGNVRDNVYLESPVDVTRQASEDGGVVVFSSGNGLANAFVVPMLTYWSSEKGPDWIVTVGAASPAEKQSTTGHGKPVDVSSIGSGYPSTGGPFANSFGTHSGTSNAAPVVAGYFANTIQDARERLGDTISGHDDGIVASGNPVTCGTADPSCALGDGVLTRAELEDLVFASVLPSEQAVDVPLYPTIPTTPHSYYYQGRGVFSGRIDGAAVYEQEAQRIIDLATGTAAPALRPDGEENWFVVDSKCRQRFWGSWSGGDYTGVEPVLDPVADPLAIAFDAWCSPLPDGFAREVANG